MARLRIILLILTVYTSYKLYNVFKDGEKPTLPQFWWGPKSKEGQKLDTSIRPFSININDKILNDLKSRLKLELSDNTSRFIKSLEGTGFEYGFNSEYLKKVGEYWLNKYDWKVREKQMNKYPQFKTNIQGIDIHFQHIKSSNNGKYKNTRPLLLLHGWPGSFVEFRKVIAELIDPKNSDINFELIIPSLPGYGFSEAGHQTGMGPAEISQICLNLMKRIGHEKFYVQGGDWGSLVATNLGTLYPENVVALHTNILWTMHPRTFLKIMIGKLWPSYFFSDHEQKSFHDMWELTKFWIQEMGYMHIQATKPDTVGVALSNSPIGLAAYIIEKFSTWTNPEWISKADGGLSKWDMDDLLDNVMVYWVSNSILTSQRLYSEYFNIRQMMHGIERVPCVVPAGFLSTPHELINYGKWLGGDKFTQIIHLTEAKIGGHFAAYEQPNLFQKDVLKFFNKVESMGLAKFSSK